MVVLNSLTIRSTLLDLIDSNNRARQQNVLRQKRDFLGKSIYNIEIILRKLCLLLSISSGRKVICPEGQSYLSVSLWLVTILVSGSALYTVFFCGQICLTFKCLQPRFLECFPSWWYLEILWDSSVTYLILTHAACGGNTGSFHSLGNVRISDGFSILLFWL